ncbi:4'-phosphopantetheinyl transferase family protein [Aminipila sp.]|uniref:4'-phosphopantetheinyl transferase family protein n=1 Tax=Aminipila sp. TaxID=2060095 RepID=UPI00289DFBEB|nr:4'-phosphopantetheinyl transferase superfamily protein [Aminipila sp.]
MKIYGIKLIQENEKDKLHYLMNFISKEKSIRISRYRRWEDFQRSLLSDVLIRSMIHRNFGIPNDKLLFKTNEYGKPYLMNSNIYYNISHSGEWVICVMNETSPVGIDIEEVKIIDFSVAKQFMTEKEYNKFEQLDDVTKQNYFYKVWTTKESYIKADGRGMNIPLDIIETNFSKNGNIQVSINALESKCYFNQFKLEKCYLITVCSAFQNLTDKIEIINIDEIVHELKVCTEL